MWYFCNKSNILKFDAQTQRLITFNISDVPSEYQPLVEYALENGINMVGIDLDPHKMNNDYASEIDGELKSLLEILSIYGPTLDVKATRRLTNTIMTIKAGMNIRNEHMASVIDQESSRVQTPPIVIVGRNHLVGITEHLNRNSSPNAPAIVTIDLTLPRPKPYSWE